MTLDSSPAVHIKANIPQISHQQGAKDYWNLFVWLVPMLLAVTLSNDVRVLKLQQFISFFMYLYLKFSSYCTPLINKTIKS